MAFQSTTLKILLNSFPRFSSLSLTRLPCLQGCHFNGKRQKSFPYTKKEKKDDPENYHPISLLCSIGKIFKKWLLNIMPNSFGHSLPSSFQHGFWRNHSTATAAVIIIQNSFARALNKKKKVIVVSTDMSAAFDLLDKDVLLPWMAKLGIPTNLIQIYNDFLWHSSWVRARQPIRSFLVYSSYRWNIWVLVRCQWSCLCRWHVLYFWIWHLGRGD